MGVIGDVKENSLAIVDPVATLYMPATQQPTRFMSLVVRAASQPSALVSVQFRARCMKSIASSRLLDVITIDEDSRQLSSSNVWIFCCCQHSPGLALLLAAYDRNCIAS